MSSPDAARTAPPPCGTDRRLPAPGGCWNGRPTTPTTSRASAWSATAASWPTRSKPQYSDVPLGFPEFMRNITLTGGVAPARAYMEDLMPHVLDGGVHPGQVFDRTVGLEEDPGRLPPHEQPRSAEGPRPPLTGHQCPRQSIPPVGAHGGGDRRRKAFPGVDAGSDGVVPMTSGSRYQQPGGARFSMVQVLTVGVDLAADGQDSRWRELIGWMGGLWSRPGSSRTRAAPRPRARPDVRAVCFGTVSFTAS